MKTPLLTALCLALPAVADGNVPEWVELIPAGIQVKGLDGREWINDKPQDILNHFNALKQSGRELVFDFEHSTELKAPKGDKAPASGWGVEMQQREDGSIWAKVNWNEEGSKAIAAKEYRYLSPVLIYEKNTRRIVGIQSVALTNKANLLVTALNSQDFSPPETPTMDIKQLLALLGLPETATLDEALAAIKALQSEKEAAMNHASHPPLDKFVPRADYDTALNQAQAATAKLAEIQKQSRDAEIETAINQALAAGKITPATKDYHVANCQQDGGLARFKAFVATAPEIAAPSGLDGRKPAEQQTALNHETQTIANLFGNSVEDLKKYGG
jgi:phage I-like protein